MRDNCWREVDNYSTLLHSNNRAIAEYLRMSLELSSSPTYNYLFNNKHAFYEISNYGVAPHEIPSNFIMKKWVEKKKLSEFDLLNENLFGLPLTEQIDLNNLNLLASWFYGLSYETVTEVGNVLNYPDINFFELYNKIWEKNFAKRTYSYDKHLYEYSLPYFFYSNRNYKNKNLGMNDIKYLRLSTKQNPLLPLTKLEYSTAQAAIFEYVKQEYLQETRVFWNCLSSGEKAASLLGNRIEFTKGGLDSLNSLKKLILLKRIHLGIDNISKNINSCAIPLSPLKVKLDCFNASDFWAESVIEGFKQTVLVPLKNTKEGSILSRQESLLNKVFYSGDWSNKLLQSLLQYMEDKRHENCLHLEDLSPKAKLAYKWLIYVQMSKWHTRALINKLVGEEFRKEENKSGFSSPSTFFWRLINHNTTNIYLKKESYSFPLHWFAKSALSRLFPNCGYLGEIFNKKEYNFSLISSLNDNSELHNLFNQYLRKIMLNESISDQLKHRGKDYSPTQLFKNKQ